MGEPDGHGASVAELDALLKALAARGRRLIGPTIRDGAILYEEIEGVADLPRGWTDEHAPGSYRLWRRADDALFGHVVGPRSWKHFLHPPERELWRARLADGAVTFDPAPPPVERLALVGVRACELAAIRIHDRVFLDGPFADPHYRALRERLFVLAVDCGEPAATCFCASMDTGPAVREGFDLALTEIVVGGERRFLLRSGSPAGRALVAELGLAPARPEERAAADGVRAGAVRAMGRAMPDVDIRGLLLAGLDHPRWERIAERCLACGNCTLVCPTCFCTTVEDGDDLLTGETVRSQRWDSCFSADFSYIHGHVVRASTAARYRQWLVHKLATWHDQFGSSGCVGCGRCITWCPVGIDITEEVAAFAAERAAVAG